MKTIKTLLLAILITFSSQVSANTERPTNELKSVSQQIGTLLNGSEVIVYDDITVMIKFRINEDNKIIVISNDSNNKEISKFIKKRLNKEVVSIKNTNKDKVYYLPITFLSTEN